MAYIHGVVEFFVGDEWYEVVNVGVLLLRHCDLYGCLFGVDNYGGFVPLFEGRGMPKDCSFTLTERTSELDDSESRASWVLWQELKEVDWSELAPVRDERITEFAAGEDGGEVRVTKGLDYREFGWVEAALARDPSAEIRVGHRIFRRVFLRRSDAIEGTDFPLVMKLMECLAERFGVDGVRLVVWFD